MLSKAFIFFPSSHIVVQKYLQNLTYSKGKPSFRRILQIGRPKDLALEPKGLIGKGKVISPPYFYWF